jgi:hypothetical protein
MGVSRHGRNRSARSNPIDAALAPPEGHISDSVFRHSIVEFCQRPLNSPQYRFIACLFIPSLSGGALTPSDSALSFGTAAPACAEPDLQASPNRSDAPARALRSADPLAVC